MNTWKHSLSSADIFGGAPDDYLAIHRFLDASKLWYYHLKHRALLHHLYGIELCEEVYGPYIQNSVGRTIPVREICAQHIREDLSKRVPDLGDWFLHCEDELGASLEMPTFADDQLEQFVLRPWLRSGLKSTLIITCSHFGVFLAEQLHGYPFARRLAESIPQENSVQSFLNAFTLTQKWQYTPDRDTLRRMKTYQSSRPNSNEAALDRPSEQRQEGDV